MKFMKLIDNNTGLMECRYCGYRHIAQISPGGRYRPGSWQCGNSVCLWERSGLAEEKDERKIHEKSN